MDEMLYVLTKISYVLKKDFISFSCSSSLFSSLPLIFTLLVASISHFKFLTAANNFHVAFVMKYSLFLSLALAFSIVFPLV